MRARTVVFLPAFLLLSAHGGPKLNMAAAPAAARYPAAALYDENLFPAPDGQADACCAAPARQGWSGMVAASQSGAHVPLAARLSVSLNTGLLHQAGRPAQAEMGGVRLFVPPGLGQGAYY